METMTHVSRADYQRPNSFEIATSWIHGSISAPAAGEYTSMSARVALEAAILPSLERGPCFVAFSGGRDSSAVLAIASDLARRHGLDAPIAVTELYPKVPESDESKWQELVLRHLGLSSWVRLEFPEGNDLLGPGARESLRHRGMIWPVALHVKSAVLEQLGGQGAFLTGEGGDEVLGRRRGAQVSRLWRREARLLRGRDLRAAASTLSPAAYRRRRVLAQLDDGGMQPWLRPDTRERHHRLAARDLAGEPLTTPRSLEWLLTRRVAAVASHNYGVLAAEHGLTLTEPLLDPAFVRALARTAGTWGYESRTAAMRDLVGDLLPAEIVGRRSKAYFNRAFMGEQTRAFAETWDGSGLDPDLIEAEVLRDEWLSDFPSAISTPLLHAAWLGSATGHEGARREPAGDPRGRPSRPGPHRLRVHAGRRRGGRAPHRAPATPGPAARGPARDRPRTGARGHRARGRAALGPASTDRGPTGVEVLAVR